MAEAHVPIESSHLFHFAADTRVTARMLGESLLGLDALVSRTKPIIDCLLGEGHIKELEVSITKIEIGSYKDNFIVRLVFGAGRKAERQIEKFRKDLRLDKMNSKQVIGIAVAGVLAWVAWQYVKPDEPARIHIENSFNQIATGTGLTGEELRHVFDGLLGRTDKTEVKRQASRLLHPAGRHNSGTVQIDNDPNLVIPPEAVKSIPVQWEPAEQEEPVEDFEAIQIVVRAADLDSNSKGWRAIIPEISDLRTPVHIMPDIKLETVPIGKYFYANVTVAYTVKKSGDRRPKHYFVTAIVKDPMPEP